ncbi:MAG: hypothetical protein MZW92_43405 [Comamonadaceae bacterium]|nr:hypothetical protein [Comamonadaceae bacterium]
MIESVRQATVSAQIAGQRDAAPASTPATASKRGQLLARIDTREADAQVATGRARRWRRPRRRWRRRSSSYDRTKSLVAQNFVSQAALDKADADLKTARAARRCGARRHGAGGRRRAALPSCGRRSTAW